MSEVYNGYVLPSWAPPSYLFGVVWPVLYLAMAISFGYVFFQFFRGSLPAWFLVPFIVNLVANLAFVYLHKWKWVALLDIFVIWLTLLIIFDYSSTDRDVAWVGYANVPYFLWVSFAFLLQGFVAVYNV